MAAAVTTERALIHLYNPVSRAWAQQPPTTIAVENAPFSEGNFRAAYRAKMTVDGKAQDFVIKFARDPNTPRSLYFNDAEAQGVAIMWAKKYNESKPPKAVEFVPSFVLELVDRPGRPLANCEQYIRGEFKKYNNNVGAAVSGTSAATAGGPAQAAVNQSLSLETRTAQCFSHFTYQHSQCQILICDIQGVGGVYTDPQIHTVTGKGFGEGNLGAAGITAFLLRHTCSDLCAHMGLSKVQPQNLDSTNAKAMAGAALNAAPKMGSKQQNGGAAVAAAAAAGAGAGKADVLIIDSGSSGSSSGSSSGGGIAGPSATPKKPAAGTAGAGALMSPENGSAGYGAANDRKQQQQSGSAARTSVVGAKQQPPLVTTAGAGATASTGAGAAGAAGTGSGKGKSSKQSRGTSGAGGSGPAQPSPAPSHKPQPSVSPKKINADDEALMNSILTS